MNSKQHILIIGAGFGGLWSALSAARLLEQHNRRDIDITLLAPQAELRIRPRFYEPEVHNMYAPLDALLDVVGIRFVRGTAERIDEQARIVDYRERNGGFRSVDELREVTGIGDATFTELKPLVTV